VPLLERGREPYGQPGHKFRSAFGVDAGRRSGGDPAQHTEMATLQRINKALILLIQEQQEANQISEAYALQQIVGQKVQQDNLKSLFVTANDYQENFNSVTPQQTSAGTSWAFHY